MRSEGVRDYGRQTAFGQRAARPGNAAGVATGSSTRPVVGTAAYGQARQERAIPPVAAIPPECQRRCQELERQLDSAWNILRLMAFILDAALAQSVGRQLDRDFEDVGSYYNQGLHLTNLAANVTDPYMRRTIVNLADYLTNASPPNRQPNAMTRNTVAHPSRAAIRDRLQFLDDAGLPLSTTLTTSHTTTWRSLWDMFFAPGVRFP